MKEHRCSKCYVFLSGSEPFCWHCGNKTRWEIIMKKFDPCVVINAEIADKQREVRNFEQKTLEARAYLQALKHARALFEEGLKQNNSEKKEEKNEVNL